MKILKFAPDRAPELSAECASTEALDSFYWVDALRDDPEWSDKLQRCLGFRIDERHLNDTLNPTHPPYFDATEDYDLLVMRAICSDSQAEFPRTCPIAFLITGNVIVTVRPQHHDLFRPLHERFLGNNGRNLPTSNAMLLYQLLNRIIDGLLEHRDDTSEVLIDWQEQLLRQGGAKVDWHAMIRLQGQLRRLEVVIDSQLDVLKVWRDQTGLAMDVSLEVRYNDLQEHLRRVYHHAVMLQHDIDALLQIYFSVTTQRTNDILQFLTIISAIFLPLNLLAGLFGMNFSHMPFLSVWYGPWLVGLVMLTVAFGMIAWFRRKHWV
ncbi:MAG: magnesium transporter CorA family protein [Candidatus Thiodiazotropha sp.]